MEDPQEALFMSPELRTPPPSIMVNGAHVLRNQPPPAGIQQKFYWEVLNEKRTGRYHLVSALHKEIRRCDLKRGMALGALYGQIYGFPRLKRYIKNILLEECRDNGLRLYLEKKMKPEEVMFALQWFIMAKKKWSLPTRQEVFKIGYSYEMIESTKAVHPGKIQKLLYESLKAGDSATAHALSGDESGWRELNRAVAAAFPNEFGLTGFHGVQTAIELSAFPETWEVGATEPPPSYNYLEPIEYPEFRRYVFDRHTLIGKKWMVNNLEEILSTKGDSAVVDLRWSGITMGCVWREVAGRSFTPEQMSDLSWSDACIPEDSWNMAVLLDRMTESKVFGPWKGE
jgi:hypothetical protein